MVPNLSRSQGCRQFATLRSTYASHVQSRTDRGMQSKVLPKRTLQSVPMRSQVTRDVATSTHGLFSVRETDQPLRLGRNHYYSWTYSIPPRQSPSVQFRTTGTAATRRRELAGV
ncbi:hypothetical protein AGABI1DRAFT_134251 [Agaricus bisporus var. burnettii JB137-S8]|uniref:Uncharacterized protein n=1 Tax=Agaricus bisporus var. burnettii (strain JB137-S8 / ATCC MYA-4627 / FGSC 10392) TaxID=597362 RepID=K5WSI8_AGABU|nr:uncharacterized protein AGABI1DRAFT_134251 [Agaricus bisporus var. burnettii JB137-S8]EKM73693.1 hypothetical protein AGABI1DRAFT_134251 [Agaricus bisporus var. burnettii JB137-S8]